MACRSYLILAANDTMMKIQSQLMQITTGTFKQESRINGQEFQWNFQTLVE